MQSKPFALTTASLVVALFLILFPGAASAQDPQLRLTVAPADNPLIIRGVLDGAPGSFGGNVRLTVTGGNASEVILLPYDLVDIQTGEQKIDRSQISIPAGVALTANQPRDLMVSIAQIQRPGIYTGSLRFLLPDQAEADGALVQVELHVTAKPKVSTLNTLETLQVVRCHWWIDCAFARLILPDNMTQSEFQVFLDNETIGEVEIESQIVVLKGERTGSAHASSSVTPALPPFLPANRVSAVPIRLDRNRLSPDRYTGAIRLTLKNGDAPVLMNLALDVRDGPVWALAAIMLGLFLGRLARGLESPVGRMQIALMEHYNDLVRKISRVADVEEKNILLDSLEVWKSDLNAARKNREALEAEGNEIERRVDLLLALQSLAPQIQKHAAVRELVKDKLQEARRLALHGDLEKAGALAREIADQIAAWNGRPMRGETPQDLALNTTVETIETAATHAAEGAAGGPAAAPRRIPILTQILARLTGLQPAAEVRYWIIRPLLFLVTVILLALLGLQTLYVNAGATFGAAGIYDYLGLFFWGVGTDVASRSLLSLAPKPEPEAG